MGDLGETFREWKEAKRIKRNKRVEGRRRELAKLESIGYTVQEFPNFHFKVNGYLNIWPSRNRFHDEATGDHGLIRGMGIVQFVKGRIPTNDQTIKTEEKN
jgi:hypothetical protein